MFINRLYIRNYRCFGDSPTMIEFSKSGITALIGPNNVGKSTVLRILEILLGDKWPSGRFSEEDFHNNELNKEIILACTFTQKIQINIKGEYNLEIIGVVVRAKHIPTGYGESSIDVEFRLLESDMNIENLDFDSLDIATYRWKNKTGESDSPIYIGQKIKNQLPVVITVPLIKLQSEQPTNKWGVLGRMLQKVENEFSKKPDKKQQFEEKIKEAVKILRIDDFSNIEKDIQTFWNKMKPTNLTGTELKFLDYEPWRYYRQFKLSIKHNGKDVPIETLGEGVQRLAIIALYRTYLKRHGRNERAILLIEEPESYLHPQARKNLFQVLKQAIKESEETEGQIIYTTHSENFIECGCFDDIVIFDRNDDCVEVRHVTEESLRNHTIALGQSEDKIVNQHIHYRLIETITQGLKEALFTHKAVIVEGPSEIELFRFFSTAEKEQIGIVSAGGKSNIPAIYTFLTAFGVPCLIATDKDEAHDGDNTKIINILSQTYAEISDATKDTITIDDINKVEDGEIYFNRHLLVFGNNLETVLSKKVNNWTELLASIRNAFNLPTDKDKPGPRDIQALGLLYNSEYNFDDNDELATKLNEAKSQLQEISKTLNEFIHQSVNKPQLLNPKQ